MPKHSKRQQQEEVDELLPNCLLLHCCDSGLNVAHCLADRKKNVIDGCIRLHLQEEIKKPPWGGWGIAMNNTLAGHFFTLNFPSSHTTAMSPSNQARMSVRIMSLREAGPALALASVIRFFETRIENDVMRLSSAVESFLSEFIVPPLPLPVNMCIDNACIVLYNVSQLHESKKSATIGGLELNIKAERPAMLWSARRSFRKDKLKVSPLCVILAWLICHVNNLNVPYNHNNPIGDPRIAPISLHPGGQPTASVRGYAITQAAFLNALLFAPKTSCIPHFGWAACFDAAARPCLFGGAS